MIDIKDLQQRKEEYIEACKNKNIEVNVESILSLDSERKNLIPKIEELRNKKNEASKLIATLQGEEKQKAIQDMQSVSTEEKDLNEKLNKIEEELNPLMLKMPLIPSPETPIGKDDTENVEIKNWGEIPNFDFEPKDHVQLGKDLDIIDIERGVKAAGSRFYYFKGDGALLEQAVLQYALQKLVQKGFTMLSPPVLVRKDAMQATGYFPGGEEQAYKMEKDDLYLVGTCEVSLAYYHSNETLDGAELPKMYAGLTNGFRREAGTYGKDTHGIYRVHQINKVEQVVICKNNPEESARLHKQILEIAEEVLQDLKLPYRILNICTGDMGQGKYYMNDIETWMPSRDSYGETHSCSNLHDFQARRLNLKYKDENGKKQFCHTLNNTCIATPRILIPLLEIYQQKDGSIKVPEVLVPYMGKEFITPTNA